MYPSWKCTEAKIHRYESEERGVKEGAAFKPYFNIGDLGGADRYRGTCATTGRFTMCLRKHAHRVRQWGEFTGDFAALDENARLERDLTRQIAKDIGISHPSYQGVDLVLTTSIRATLKEPSADEHRILPVMCLSGSELRSSRVMEAVEIGRRAWKKLGASRFVIVPDSDRWFPRLLAENLATLDPFRLRKDLERHEGYAEPLLERIEHAVVKATGNTPLDRFAHALNEKLSLPAGEAFNFILHLIWTRRLKVDMKGSLLHTQPVGEVAKRSASG